MRWKMSAARWLPPMGVALCLLLMIACGEPEGTGSVGACESREASSTLRGQVATSACTEIVASATVTLLDELLLQEFGSTTTNVSGEFSMAVPSDGRYILRASKGPFSGRSGAFEISGGRCAYQVVQIQ